MTMRKTDRRTIYTKNIIKDSLLDLLKHIPYEKITVTAICKRSEITRATFYLHYDNIDEVLDEVLDEALRLTELDDNFSISSSHLFVDAEIEKTFPPIPEDPDILLPPCQRAASNPKYRILFLDETMSHHILEKLYKREKGRRIPEIMNTYHVSEWEADKLFLFMLHGSFAVNKALGWNKTPDWHRAQKVIQGLIEP